MLSFSGEGSFSFSLGSILVLGATVCWGLENSCTRKISVKSTYEIVTIKGIGSGIGSFIVVLVIMISGTVLIIRDTLIHSHKHAHIHLITHTHDGSTHTHAIEHSHDHAHVIDEGKHGHTHNVEELEIALGHRGVSNNERFY